MAKFLVTLWALLAACLVITGQAQMIPNGQMQGGLGGFMGNLMGGSQSQMPSIGQMPNQMNGNMMMQGGQGGLNGLLRNLPQQTVQMIQNLINSVRQALPNSRGQQMMSNGNYMNNNQQQLGQLLQGLLGNLQQQQQPGQQQQQGGLLGALGQNNPLGSLTSNLNGLTNSLQQQTGLPLNSLGQSLQSTLGNIVPGNMNGQARMNM